MASVLVCKFCLLASALFFSDQITGFVIIGDVIEFVAKDVT